jgi:hypothetical protein
MQRLDETEWSVLDRAYTGKSGVDQQHTAGTDA